MSQETLEIVRRVLADGLNIDADTVVPEASITEDLGADSLDAVELVMSLEEEFNIEVEAGRMEGLKTVQDLIDLIDSLKA
jgi:acyl carrier protein